MSASQTTTVQEPSKAKHHRKSKDKPSKVNGKKRRRESADDSSSKEKRLRSERGASPTTALLDLGSAINTPFHLQTLSLYVTLSPISQFHPLRGICAEHLSPLILTYHPALQGVVLSYHSPRLSESPEHLSHGETKISLAKSIDEYAVSFIWVTAEFLVFRPQRNAWLEGWINLQNEGHIGLVCWNLFNASIERKRLPDDWKWKGAVKNPVKEKLKDDEAGGETAASGGNEGYFEDEQGNRVSGTLKFRVKDIETSTSTDREKGFLSIEGTLLSEAGKQQLGESWPTRRQRNGNRNTMMSGARVAINSD